MSGLFPRTGIREDYRATKAGLRDEQPAYLFWDGYDYERLRPWCRICQNPVQYFVFDRYAGDFWGFYVRCHGDAMGGLVPDSQPGNYARLEVFAYEDPHHPLGPWWWVDSMGRPAQESQCNLHNYQETPSYFRSPVGVWLREHVNTFIALIMLFNIALALLLKALGL